MPYKDKKKQKIAQHESYIRNKDIIYENSLRDKKKKRLYVQKLKDVPCMDCKKSFPPYAMDFDHRDGNDKLMNISALINYSWDRLLLEIKKCDIVCAICHRIRTYKRGL